LENDYRLGGDFLYPQSSVSLSAAAIEHIRNNGGVALVEANRPVAAG